MPVSTDPIVFANLLEQAKKLRDTGDWKPFRPGVTAHWLYNEGSGGAAAVLSATRLARGSRYTSMSATSISM
jgi:hypothetical protein